MRSHYNDGNFWQLTDHLIQQLKTAGAWHPDIGHDDIRLVLLGMCQHIVCVFKKLGFKTGVTQRFVEDPTNRRIIVHNPNSGQRFHVL